MSVLILADERDPSADAMVCALRERDAVVHRVDTAWFPGQLSVSAELTGGRWSGQLRTPYRTVDLDGITAVWFRSPKAYTFPDGMSSAERGFANLEAKYGLGGVLTSLPARWINHPARLADAAYKPVQLALAQRHGLRVADTMITNEATSVRQFAGRGTTVTKVLGSNSIVECGGRKLAYTRVLDAADLSDMRGIDQTTHLFQRWADKLYEARMIVVGDAITAVAIRANTAAGYLDWRTDYDNLSYELIQPPESIAGGVRELMQDLGLLYGALDFVVGPDGWTFLEVNAGGQYGWLEDATGISITAQLADQLTMGRAT
ncbi:ATP-grasp ribosomal peptide maturase [Tamaricihabitans halophyticus]|uniref:ATP-grasp ribosomal peptide maturase n=1 Tax=Tamaricihabitans halophyticus TaxID=1262583 RepID=A0A4R2Q616_9PSEU|nr:ATP-grasp ribosomal peptide maturase [Tamaricihabitans halophyticus]TCP43404.1 ATP-grasp ribosomal peptide maturase [Tamaricihabitans halophyticus]